MAFIKAISYYLPETVMTNEDLVKDFPGWRVDKIAEKVGVESRHLAAEDETAGDLAEKAARKLFSEYDINPQDIDFVLLCTQSPDYLLPSTACLLQDRLGIPTSAGAFDYNLGCSGCIYGMALAKGLIAGGIAKSVLLLTAETYNKIVPPAPVPEPEPVVEPEPAPAPAPAPVVEKIEPIRRDVFFLINKTDIRATEAQKVKDIADYLKKYPKAKVVVTGYADAGTGNDKINDRLAAQRADVVVKAQKEQYGIAADRISYDSKGSRVQPFAENDLNRVSICIAE